MAQRKAAVRPWTSRPKPPIPAAWSGSPRPRPRANQRPGRAWARQRWCYLVLTPHPGRAWAVRRWRGWPGCATRTMRPVGRYAPSWPRRCGYCGGYP
eukprot:scaffold13034_cov54-Phaeocystis_antarctica.AAC.3